MLDRTIPRPFLESLGSKCIFEDKKKELKRCFWTFLLLFLKSMLFPNPARVYFWFEFLTLIFVLLNAFWIFLNKELKKRSQYQLGF